MVNLIDGKHSKVALIDMSPGSFSDEFNNAVILAVKNLPTNEKRVIKDFHNYALYDDNGNIQETHWNNVSVAIPSGRVEFTGNNGVQFPNEYAKLLKGVTQELNTRYNYLSDDKRFQLVKTQDAKNVFENLKWVSLGD
jgi:hypothetical protein